MCFKKEDSIVLHVEGMMCEHCKKRVTDAVKSVSGVESVDVNLKKKSVKITGNADISAVKSAIENAGYKVI